MRKIFFALLVVLFGAEGAGANNVLRIEKADTLSFLAETDTVALIRPLLYKPEESGMSSVKLSRVDAIVKQGIAAKAFPGCQVFVMKDGKPVYDKSFGTYTYESKQKVHISTLYDLASVSKTTGTLLAIMKLYDTGKLKLTDPASAYLTFLRGTDKENITIRDLLLHETGLPGSLPFYRLAVEKKDVPSFLVTGDTTHLVRLNSPTLKYRLDRVSKMQSVEFQIQVSDSFYLHHRFHSEAMQMIAHTRLNGKTYLYSCVNFILLKEIAEAISGMSMDAFLEREFFAPMKLNNIAYLPLRKHTKEVVAPTLKKDFLRNGVVQGFVHDPAAAFLGGVSGNAGLFATARDVATVYQMILNDGELDGKRYLSAETCKLFTTTTSVSGRRGLGFDKPTPDKPNTNPCALSAPHRVYGHTGYTGTCVWVDPVDKMIYVFLSNRTYPADGENKLAKLKIRPRIHEAIYQAIKVKK
jgi:CubicO group peptidase (beta-lactamase class C family)